MASRRMFHPVMPGWKDSGRLVVIIHGTAYRTLNSYSTFLAAAIPKDRLERLIAKGHQMLETNPKNLPDFIKEGSEDEIYGALFNPEATVLSLDLVEEQIFESVTVKTHPGLSLTIRDLQEPEDSDSDISSNNTVTLRDCSRHISPTTLMEDATGLGFDEIPDSQSLGGSEDELMSTEETAKDDRDTETVFQDCQEPEDTPTLPPFLEFGKETIDETMSQYDPTKDWNSKSALEGDRFDQMEIVV
ncbi:hypothetical protein BGX38DRAFT_1272382 [Terfezia claveryi]|nr:hypothetical protein BGX38DRAFT_1272382 [Terfezia claveryi]